ncbi:putative choline dehydrogenase [Rosellinia necatrix]|uniref:Putative choline dehydrogenase n=1 Tax=Rosellinia necatrix TaxID=77044 RepID=A0A1W2TWC4_ROSNE|nr:putative choline dehydrogenase [Rosellinia necatrix]
MLRKTIAVLLVSFASSCNSKWTESLRTTGLIGSHFGVPGLDGTYDYVVVGGGTGGLAIASRLAEKTGISVAVVNAGDFYEFANGNNTEIPAYASAFIGSNPTAKNPLLDWYQYTEKQPGLGGRSVLYPSGKVLGGGSARNFMWFHRASKSALQMWADLTGDEGYLFENLLPYYKKSASFTPPDEDLRLANSTVIYDQSAWSSTGGPLQVGFPNWVNPISSWIARGLEFLGLENLPGFLDGNIIGYAYTQFALDSRTQTRSSSETSFLRDSLLKSTNLIVYKNTLVKKIEFNSNKRASSVLVDSGHITYRLNATKEIIVSAGAFRSPQLLMVSGIGPRTTLENLDIEVIADLPGVGQNMWDHIAFSPAYAVNLITHSSLSAPDFGPQQVIDYQTSRTGQLTNSGGDILGFARFPNGLISNATRADLDAAAPDWPDYEHLFLDGYFGYANDMSDAPTDGRNYVSSSTALTNPFSRGNVTIVSNNTEDYPLVSPNWLLDPRDQEVAVAAFKRARAVFTNNATRSIVLGHEAFPGSDVSTDEEILQLIQDSAAASYHASCTCAMGLPSNPLAVLDSEARVYGVKGLRVVDASAFPVLPPGHPTATVYALAERIADLIIHAG